MEKLKYDYKKSTLNTKFNKTVKKVQKFEWKHRNLILLAVSVTLSYFILRSKFATAAISELGTVGYLGSFIGGLFFSYGITAPPAVVALFLLSEKLNPFIVAATGALGALISDYLIFRFVRDRLLNELKTVSEELKLRIPHLQLRVKKSKIFKWAIPTIAGLIIASPLPDEIAAALFAVVRYDPKKFATFSYVSNFLGILAIAYASKIL